jgi:hypothetical protein
MTHPMCSCMQTSQCQNVRRITHILLLVLHILASVQLPVQKQVLDARLPFTGPTVHARRLPERARCRDGVTLLPLCDVGTGH